MKAFSLRSALAALTAFGLSLFADAAPTPPGGGGAAPVVYNPLAKVVQGNQPLAQSYVLSVTSPSNLPVGTSATVTLNGSMLSQPAGVDDATALSFLSMSPNTLTFTAPSQTLTTTVSVNVPIGQYAGNYAYRIKPSGWPASISVTDEGATVNALVSPPTATDDTPPSVLLQIPVNGTIYTYYPATGQPVSVPVVFEGTVGTGGQPITSLQAFVNNEPLSISTTGIGTLDATGTGSLSLTTPGVYHVRVTATNQTGTSEDNGDFTVVVSAPPPTIAVASPLPNTVYTFQSGGSGVTVPLAYTATSIYGNITATAVTLNGAPLTVALSGVGSSLVATGSASINISTPGNYVLGFTAQNDYGYATPVTVPFSVKSVQPVPSVTVLTPVAGTTYNRTAGDAPTSVPFTFSGGTTFGTVQSVTVTVDGATVPATVTGLGSLSITGSGTLSYSASGTHTLTVTLSNGYATASDSTTFSVQEKEVSAEICAKLTWLPPISLNKTVEGGSIVPIKFTLSCQCDFVRDETLLISIYEILPNGTMTDPVIYPYGGSNPDVPDYAINGHHYQLNYPTANGVHHYRIEVYHPLTGGQLQLLGTKDLLTKEGKSCGDKNQHDDHNGNCNNGGGKDDDHGGSNNHGGNCDNGHDGDNSHNGGHGDDKDCRDGKDDDHGSNSGWGSWGNSGSSKDCDDDKGGSKSSGSSNSKNCDDDKSGSSWWGSSSSSSSSKNCDDGKSSSSSSSSSNSSKSNSSTSSSSNSSKSSSSNSSSSSSSSKSGSSSSSSSLSSLLASLLSIFRR